MNDPSSDGNENVIDIFVLCASETEAPLNTEHLEQKGYQVTLFSDTAHLFETLRYGKPNLLICDSHTLGEDAFETCRKIKADNDLWMIPVLIMTRASSLSDLLFVLDCNADNFIAYPYDPSYLHSLIEGMLQTPVERPTPEQIKTQFKIQHDEHLFVVTADRRKLLEFLLSSFEIAVNKSDELSRARSENHDLRQVVVKADEVAGEQARAIGILNSTVRQKEEALSALTDEVRDKASQVAELNREKEFFIKEREADKNLIGEAEDRIRVLIHEKEEAERIHSTEAGELNQRLAATSEECATAKSDLEATREALEQETSLRTGVEATLAELVSQKEQLERSLRAATLECEQVKSACSAEQNRASAAEQENKSLILAKAQSEQDLTRIIDELKEKARQQAGELITLREEQAAGRDQVRSLEDRLAALAAEKEAAETGLVKAADDLRHELEGLTATCDTSRAALEEKTKSASELEQALTEERSVTARMQSQVQSLEGELGTLRQAFQEKTRGAGELEQALSEERSATARMQSQVQSLEGELGTLRQAFEEKTRSASELEQALTEERSGNSRTVAQVQALESELGALRQAFQEKTQSSLDLEHICNELKDAGGQALAQIRALDSEIEQLHAALEGERQQHAATRQSLQGALQERDTALTSLQGAHREVKSDLDSHRDDLALAKQELATVAGERASLHNRLAESAAQIRSLEEKLAAASGDQAESDTQIRSLSDELDLVKAALETERRQRRTDEENIRSAVTANEKAEEAARRITDEQERMKKMLVSEQEERRNAEGRLRSLEEESEQRVRDLSEALAEARGKIAEFEERLRRVTQEKEEARELAASLEAEIEQARAALADEWEDHVTDNERFAAAAPSAVPGPAAGTRAVVSPNPGLPPAVAATPKAVVAVSPPFSEAKNLRVTRVEDLFEDEMDDDDEELPSVSIIRDPVPEDPGLEFVSGLADDAEAGEDLGNEDEESFDEPDDTEDEDTTGDEDDEPAPSFNPLHVQPATQFDRSQWLDLLKWAHHSGALSQEQRLQIVRMGRLIQKGRRLTNKQDEQVREMITLAQSLGYRFS